MIGLSHVILHVALCSAAARTSAETPLAMHVVLSYRVGGTALDKVLRVERGSGPTADVEFDAPRGVLLLQLDMPKYHCSGSDFLSFLPEHDRTIAETLTDSPAPPPRVTLLEGTAPMTFSYAKPTFVLFDSIQGCDQPVGTPLPSHFVVEHERDAYYVWWPFEASPDGRKPVLALRLRTPTGLFHYIRLNVPFPPAGGGWPASVTFNVGEDELATIVGEKVDTLLCPRLWTTSVNS